MSADEGPAHGHGCRRCGIEPAPHHDDEADDWYCDTCWADHADVEGGAFALVMPYVVVTSEGGPFDDAAFVAGVRFGSADAQLKAMDQRVQEWCDTVEPALVPQYDLLAMHHGFVMTSEPWAEHPNDWVFVTFRRPTEGAPDAE